MKKERDRKFHIVNATPTGMFVFFSWGDGRLSRLITKVTGGPSHTGVGFTYADGSSYIYEALFARGVVGPKPFYRVKEWAKKAPGRMLEIVDVQGLSPAALATKQLVADGYVGTAGYAELQLLAMYCFERFGRRVKTSTAHVVCSEYAARVLLPEINVATADRDLDEASPSYLRETLLNKFQFPGRFYQ